MPTIEFTNLNVFIPLLGIYTIIFLGSLFCCIRLRAENAILKRGLHLITIQGIAMYILAVLNLVVQGPFFELKEYYETDTMQERKEIADGDLWGYRIYTCLAVEAMYYLFWPPLWISKLLIASSLFKNYWGTAFKIEILHRSSAVGSTTSVMSKMNPFQRAICKLLRYLSNTTGQTSKRISGADVISPVRQTILKRTQIDDHSIPSVGKNSAEDSSAYVKSFHSPHHYKIFLFSALVAVVAFLITFFTSRVNYLYHTEESETHMCPIEDNWYLFLNQGLWLITLPIMVKLLGNMNEPYLIREELVIYAILSLTFSVLYALHYVREPRLIPYAYAQFIYTGGIHMMELVVSVTLPAAVGYMAVYQRKKQLSRPRGNLQGFEMLMKDHRLWDDFKSNDLAKGFALENALFVEEYKEWQTYCEVWRYGDEMSSLQRSKSVRAANFNGASVHPGKGSGNDDMNGLKSPLSPGATMKSPTTPTSRNWLTKFQAGSTTELSNMAPTRRDTVMKCAVEQLNRRYLLPDAVHELNIPARIREGIQQCIRNEEYDLNMFKPVYDEVVQLMYLTYYPNFMRRHCTASGNIGV